jgi:hypothetical protein
MALVMLAIFPLAGLGQWLEVKYLENRHEKDKKENENAGHVIFIISLFTSLKNLAST